MYQTLYSLIVDIIDYSNNEHTIHIYIYIYIFLWLTRRVRGEGCAGLWDTKNDNKHTFCHFIVCFARDSNTLSNLRWR